jgi:IMP dehydrogenase
MSTRLTKNIQVDMPLVPANMDSVIGPDLARVVVSNGGIPIFHRFTDFKTQQDWVREFDGKVFLSCGVGKFDEISDLISLGPLGLCIDVAHGHSDRMVDLVKRIKDTYPRLEVIAGNICTARAYHDLVNAGADAIKVGIGPGAACTTRSVTGFGVPQFTAIKHCAEEAAYFGVPIIADGGIRNSSDVVKALAIGASTVMIGKLFALTEESAAEKSTDVETFESMARYRGQASADFQEEFYGGLKEKTVAEGTGFLAPVSGPAQGIVDELLGGLRSGLTYSGARCIAELQSKAEFMQVSVAYGAESNPRRT